jgi:alkylation response protein AidB-like acyl-CoA dehydrogenase
MDFEMTEDQKMLYRVTYEFAKEELRPKAKELDKKTNPMERVDWELIRKASLLGFRTLTWPEEYGGIGADLLTTVIHYEALSWGDGGFSHYFFQSHVLGASIPGMPKQLKDEIFVKMAGDDTYLMGISNTESCGATEYTLPYDVPGSAFQTVADKKGDEYIINGTKEYCSNGPIAKIISVSVQTNRQAPLSQSWSQIMVPAGTPGLSVGKIHEHMGMRLLPTAEMIFDNVHVPAHYLVGEEGKSLESHHRVRPRILTIHNAQMLGILQALYDDSLEFAQSRIVCGKPVIEHASIKLMLADMRMKIEAARALIYKTAWNLDHKKEDFKNNTEVVYLAKAFLDEIALTIMRDADEIHGGMGTNKEMLSEKLIRDTFTMLHWMNTRSIAYLKGAPTLEGVSIVGQQRSAGAVAL